MMTLSCARAALLMLLMASAAPAFAQQTPGAGSPRRRRRRPSARTYTPADFTRFAPRNAFDMLQNVPGFAIDQGDTERRGLGQATGNVLINGERFSGKSTDISTELRRISASNVARIEIVDGATLNISGLSGQVANVITVSRGLSGNFVYRPQIRARRTPFRWSNGEISVNGSIGATQYTLSLRNNSYRNGNAGPELVTTPAGLLLDTRAEILSVYGDQPRLSGTIRRNFANGSILNVNLAGGIFYEDLQKSRSATARARPTETATSQQQTRQYDYELGGDYEFGLGGGRLKLIGLRHFTHTPVEQTLIQTYADATPTLGERFTQAGNQTETIGRGEYRWHGGGADWQISLEGALNRLDVDNGLFDLDGAGDFVAMPFPNSAATIQERRAEAMLTYGRPLAPHLTLQASIGGEYSQLSQDGAGGLTRTFYRPKGFVNLAWQPRPGLDLSARIERVVGQLNFFDFVASGNVSAGTQNAGNANLVPPQSWNGQIQAVRNFGRWGNATARLYGRLISDIVDVIPVNGGQSPGNLPGTASVYGVQWTSTFNLDPIGITGAKLDLSLQFQKTRLTDPLTGAHRPINENITRQIDIDLPPRHPAHRSRLWRRICRFQAIALASPRPALALSSTRPGTLAAYVEHKDVFGLTVRATVDNLLGTNESFGRAFYDGLGPTAYCSPRIATAITARSSP